MELYQVAVQYTRPKGETIPVSKTVYVAVYEDFGADAMSRAAALGLRTVIGPPDLYSTDEWRATVTRVAFVGSVTVELPEDIAPKDSPHASS